MIKIADKVNLGGHSTKAVVILGTLAGAFNLVNSGTSNQIAFYSTGVLGILLIVVQNILDNSDFFKAVKYLLEYPENQGKSN